MKPLPKNMGNRFAERSTEETSSSVTTLMKPEHRLVTLMPRHWLIHSSASLTSFCSEVSFDHQGRNEECMRRGQRRCALHVFRGRSEPPFSMRREKFSPLEPTMFRSMAAASIRTTMATMIIVAIDGSTAQG